MRLGVWVLGLGVLVLAGCQSLASSTAPGAVSLPLPAALPASAAPNGPPNGLVAPAFACEQPEASCHKGRFGLVWRQRLADGEEQNEVVSGVYAWESGFKPAAISGLVPYAKLSLRTSLGPALGELQQLGPVYQARLADGQVLMADSWQGLFGQIFVADLPVEPLLAWLHSPQASAPPNLPAPWQWRAESGRYRLQQQTDTLFARVDFIVQP